LSFREINNKIIFIPSYDFKMRFFYIFLTLLFLIQPNTLLGSQWIEGNRVVLQGLDKITARIKTFEVNVGESQRFGVLDIFVERCVYSKPIYKPESLALIKIEDNSERLSVVEFRGWMFASSPALNALENPVYDISVLVCKNSDRQSKKSSSPDPIE